jgi:hypothetical protein
MLYTFHTITIFMTQTAAYITLCSIPYMKDRLLKTDNEIQIEEKKKEEDKQWAEFQKEKPIFEQPSDWINPFVALKYRNAAKEFEIRKTLGRALKKKFCRTPLIF